MTQPQLSRLCRLWQRRLRLADWDIVPVLVTEADMPEELGLTDPIETDELRAGVKVRDCEATEATLVHELLHLRLLPFDGTDEEAKEQAINLLADCFLKAYPRKKATTV